MVIKNDKMIDVAKNEVMLIDYDFLKIFVIDHNKFHINTILNNQKIYKTNKKFYK